MHSALTHSKALLSVLAPVVMFAVAGCGVQAQQGGKHQAGHGQSSVAGLDLSQGDHTNGYDSTDDLTDPAFVPNKAAVKAGGAEATGSASSAISSTVGTKFQLTYYVVSQRPSNDPAEVDLYDCDGNWLTGASQSWSDDADMQGTAMFKGSNGSMQTINTSTGCWLTLPYSQRWGLGVENPATGNAFELRPFRSIAVDPSVLKVGKWYYVKELDGVKLPSPAAGTTHDGCVRAMDVGPAINGRHIDFFSGYYSAYTSLINGSSTLGGKDSITLYDGASKCATHVSRGY